MNSSLFGFVFSLELRKYSNIIDESRRNLQVLTGTTGDSYPSYDASDPYVTALRGFFFTGTSMLQLPPHADDTSDSIVFASTFASSMWIRP